MKRNSLTTAVVAGIAGVAGFAGLANAVDLNPDGLGQTLIYPYYTVENQQQTLISVVNTTGVSKAVKIRFLEGYNSEEVLDFHIFLSPYDVWAGTVFDEDEFLGSASQGNAAVFTQDTTCTKPYLYEGENADGSFAASDGSTVFYKGFVNTVYMNDPPGTDTSLGRTREGHVEIISMADIIPGSATDFDVTHIGGVPADCDDVNPDPSGPIAGDLVAPTGGIYGAGAVVHAEQGTFYTYNADALDGFTAINIYGAPGDTDPSLAFVNGPGVGTATAYVFQNGALITSTYNTSGVPDAVSAVFDSENLYNEYNVNADVGANTDWVVTFPTKRFYVDSNLVASPVAPFVSLFSVDSTNNSCTAVGISMYDREEGTPVSTCNGGFGGSCFSPPPPGQPPNAICKETNVISFLPTSDPNAGVQSGVLGSFLVLNIPPFGANGWMNLNLNPTVEPHAMNASLEGNVFYGLPATGFEAVNYVNNAVQAGVLSNYSGTFRHRASRDCIGGGGDGGSVPCS